MLSKTKIKFIKSLQIKKYRKQEQCFIVQGAKSVQELLASDFETVLVAGTPYFLSTMPNTKAEVIEANEKELEALGAFESNDTVIAVAKMKPNVPVEIKPKNFGLLLDDIRDPGNLGTIIRTADWFGISALVASPDTVDFYNPKVISATMGSFTRVRIYVSELENFLLKWKGKVYGAYLDGNDVHKEKFTEGGVVLIGNESHGISDVLEKYVTNRITIPKYGRAESLNAAIATAIICDTIQQAR